MFRSPATCKLALAASLLAADAVLAAAARQEPRPPGNAMPGNTAAGDTAARRDEGAAAGSGEQHDVERLISDLDAADFRRRQQAVKQLTEIGEPALDRLRHLERTGSAEQRLRAQIILERIQRDSFAGRLADLEESQSVAAAARLPYWQRFSELVGQDAPAVRLFTQLMQAEPELFAAALQRPETVPAALRNRVMTLQETLSPGPLVEDETSAQSVAAILLIASDETVRLPGATSTTVSTLAASPVFAPVLSRRTGESMAYRRLAGAWVLRQGIAPQRPLLLAQTYELPEGPMLARRVLKTALRGANGWYALTLLGEQGTVQDLPLLESLFNNASMLYAATQSPDENSYRVQVGDVALAAAIRLRGEDPRRFGFPDATPGRPWSFAVDSTGFANAAARTAALQKYGKRFSNRPDDPQP